MYTILAINPGSASTKVAVYQDNKTVVMLTVQHAREELEKFDGVLAQFDFRKQSVIKALEDSGFEISQLDAVIGRGGLTKPIKSGVYEVNERMLDDLSGRKRGIHASNLGAMLAYDIAKQIGAKAYIADPVVLDEMQDVERVTGLPNVHRRPIFHALNQKAVARTYADSIGRSYEDLNLIVVHMGGGISVGAHCHGEVIDVNNALEGEGPCSPDRSGGLVAVSLAEMLLTEVYDLTTVVGRVEHKGGVIAHLGANSIQDVVKMMNEGDDKAKLVLDAMCYNIAKYIGSMGTVLKGEVDAIILTGGIAYNKYVCDFIKDMIWFIGDVVVHPGENELEALASNALRVLQGELEPRIYE